MVNQIFIQTFVRGRINSLSSQLNSITNIENNLIGGLKEGIKDCYVQLYKAYYKDLCAYAFKILSNSAYTEEIVQQVFLNIWEKRNELNIYKDIRQYLFRAVHNQALTFIKRNNKYNEVRLETTQSTEISIENDNLIQDELEQKIQVAIEKIPGKAQRVFKLSRYEGKTNEEVAQILNISKKGVEFHITNALRFLSNELKEYLPIYIASFGFYLIKYAFFTGVALLIFVFILGGCV